jgi:hypothetical protein
MISDFGQAWFNGTPATDSNRSGIDPDFLIEVVFSCKFGAFHGEQPLPAFSFHVLYREKIDIHTTWLPKPLGVVAASARHAKRTNTAKLSHCPFIVTD